MLDNASLPRDPLWHHLRRACTISSVPQVSDLHARGEQRGVDKRWFAPIMLRVLKDGSETSTSRILSRRKEEPVDSAFVRH
jgi:hypothetical protein